MKKITLFFISLLAYVTAGAQLIRDDRGQIVPFSLSELYKELIDTSSVNTCKLPAYNNDSLYWVHNFVSGQPSPANSQAVGFTVDTAVNLKEVATKYILPTGTLWLYKIESPTALKTGVYIEKITIPEGALLSFFSKPQGYVEELPEAYTSADILKERISQSMYGNQLFIEYFEPNQCDFRACIIIDKLVYYYTHRNKLLHEAPKWLRDQYPDFDFGNKYINK